MAFWRRKRNGNGGTAVADDSSDMHPGEARTSVEDEFRGTTEELLAEIERCAAALRVNRDREEEHRLLRLRHLAGIRLTEEYKGNNPSDPEPDASHLPESAGLPDISPSDLTAGLLRAGIMHDGSVLVRGLVDRDEALRLADEIDRTFAERDRFLEAGSAAEGYYREFEPDPRYWSPMSRPWIKAGGGVLAVDSPMLAFDMLDLFDRVGLSQLARDYLGEPVGITAQKTTLRKATPDVPGAWHQDGAFMGEVRALNVWLSLSRCGDESPGLDIVPRRLDEFVTAGGEGASLSYQVLDKDAQEAAGPDTPIIRPIFEPGDVLLFDDKCLHQTASDPSMPKPRFAIESWFFGASAFPSDYAPIAV